MGKSASAIITYGIAIGEDDKYILPWNSEEDEEDLDYEEWWYKEMEYTPPFEIYTPDGNEYIGGTKPNEDVISQYYDNKRQWLLENPMPFVVKGFGYESNGEILTSPSYPCIEVEWESIAFDPNDLVIEVDENFAAFIKKYLPNAIPPSWILAAKLF